MLDVIAGATRWIHFENYIIRERRRRLALRRGAGRAGARGRPASGCCTTGSARSPRSRAFWRYLRAGRRRGPRRSTRSRPLRPRRQFLAQSPEAGRGRRRPGRDRRALHRLRVDRRDATPAASRGATPRSTSRARRPRCWTRRSRGPGQLAGRHGARRARWPGGWRREGEAEVRVISGEPGRERAYRVIELLAAGSVERLWITDAYLVAPPRLFQALRDAARDGVDVRLLVPGLERPAAGPEPLPHRLPRAAAERRPDLRVGRPDAARQDHRGRRPLGPGRLEQPQPLEPARELRAGRADRGPRAGRRDGAPVPAATSRGAAR